MILTPTRIQQLLRQVRRRRLSVRQAYAQLRALPYDHLGFATLDTHRAIRRRYPEVVFCDGKTAEQICGIVARLGCVVDPLILTRVTPTLFQTLSAQFPHLRYHSGARMATWNHRRPARHRSSKYALLITAGTSDLPVAEEARVTLEAFGHRVRQATDIGVAGIHRLTEHLPLIRRAAVIIVVAGMDGALPSVIGGVASCPVIAVPTSVGYGASFRGVAPLLTMLNTCAPGVVVVNIDNGFGAGYFASLLLASKA